jgi:hypothetical protein
VTGLHVVAAVLLALGCEAGADPQRGADAQRRIQDWLLCEECTDGELEGVVALGAGAVPSLVATLRGGLSPASRASFQQQLVETWDGGPGSDARLSRDQFVEHHVGNRDALLRVRAARALGRIGTPEARAALREALVVRHRPSVEESIRDALEEPTPIP